MTTMKASLGVIAGLVLSTACIGAQAAPVTKCVVDGTVTFQHGPCPNSQPRTVPTPLELNAQQKRRRAASAPASSAPASAPSREAAAPEALAPQAGFRCDGRRYCSQMKSCAEATYFLAHCPGVKMDGDKNGVPCEQQWCGERPAAGRQAR